MLQYLIHVRDKHKIEFLKNYGTIIHVSKLSGMIVFEGEKGKVIQLSSHPDVIKISQADNLSLTAK